jgi:glyoxylase-like metal-dependent hydrolase (beta-lactamase superfamily II)
MPKFLFLLAAFTITATAAERGAPIKAEYKLDRVSPHVYVMHGPIQLPTPDNQGFMNNPGVVMTKAGVVIVDPGSSVQIGEMLLAKIRALTKAPVVAVFGTHIHGDHWLGNDAIHAAYPAAKLYAHPDMIARAANDGAGWITVLEQLTNNAITGTRVVAPDRPVNQGDEFRIGDVRFRIHYTGMAGKAHSVGDIMIEVVEDKLLFLGDNSMNNIVRRLDDGDFRGNIAALDAGLATKADFFVPGHGRTGGREVPRAYRDWLANLYAAVQKYRAQGLSDFEMKDKVVADLSAYHAWPGFDHEIGKLISIAYLQIERDEF